MLDPGLIHMDADACSPLLAIIVQLDQEQLVFDMKDFELILLVLFPPGSEID